MKKIKILIMGLPGSGKTFLAKRFSKVINAEWLNADKIRGINNDWDFTDQGILRQVKRMRKLADRSKKKYIVADFVCPLKIQIKIFRPNLIVWMDTIKKGRYPSMNKIFKAPQKYHLRIKEKDIKINLLKLKDKVFKYEWKNNHSTALMLGRYQPWHYGHKKIFEKSLIRTGQVLIFVKDVYRQGDNPFSFKQVKNFILKDLIEFKNRFKVIKAPNITNIFYGRKVGYKIKKINLDKNIQKISATKIRKKLRKLKKTK